MNKLKIIFIALCFSFGLVRAGPAIEVIASPNATTMHYGGNTLWTYQHDPGEGKPYFHPLHSRNGELLTELRPKDHPWHRGLWFSWKYINGVNYWEENRETGQSDGRTRLISTEKSIDDAQQVAIHQRLEYAPGEKAVAALQESRAVFVTPPDASGDYLIDWTSEFRALQDVKLDRTPIPGEPGGKKYGGYAGLSIRLSRADIGGSFLGPDGRIEARGIQNQSSEWMIWNTPGEGAVLMIDHPENLRAPTKWYLAPTMPYYSPAVLFDAPYSMKKGETLMLRYRILVSSKAITADKAVRAYRVWTEGEECSGSER